MDFIYQKTIVTAEDDIVESDIYDSAEVLNTKFGIITKKAKGKTN